jgi:hypothetical protein
VVLVYVVAAGSGAGSVVALVVSATAPAAPGVVRIAATVVARINGLTRAADLPSRFLPIVVFINFSLVGMRGISETRGINAVRGIRWIVVGTT